MKKQTYISYIENTEGGMVDFNRWTYARPETIIKKYVDALKKDKKFWRTIWRDGVTLAIYATPDGSNIQKPAVYTASLDMLGL